jgi:hypothetical protein
MAKPIKLVVSIFVGIDIFVFGYLALSQLRMALFGEGQIPGGGSALDMALFLIPVFVGYVAGDRLYYFLTYKERRAAKQQQSSTVVTTTSTPNPSQENKEDAALVSASVWQDRGWDDEEKDERK